MFAGLRAVKTHAVRKGKEKTDPILLRREYAKVQRTATKSSGRSSCCTLATHAVVVHVCISIQSLFTVGASGDYGHPLSNTAFSSLMPRVSDAVVGSF